MVIVFFQFCIYNWNGLDDKIKILPTLTQFKKDISSFVRPKGTSFYGIRDNFRIKSLTKIRVGFSDLRDHRYNHNFNCVNPIRSCGIDDETPIHYFLCCSRYNSLRSTYLCKISEIVRYNVSVLPNDHLIQTFMYDCNVLFRPFCMAVMSYSDPYVWR